MMFLRGDIWRAVAINCLQAPTLLSLRGYNGKPSTGKSLWCFGEVVTYRRWLLTGGSHTWRLNNRGKKVT